MSNLEGYEAQQQARHFQHKPVQPVLYELVQRTSKGDFRESWTEEQTISVHSTELGAYKAGLKTSFIVRPLEVKD
jgi:hypothetical protein